MLHPTTNQYRGTRIEVQASVLSVFCGTGWSLNEAGHARD